MVRKMTSVRLDEDVRSALSDAAAAEGATQSGLIERLLREGLAAATHPGIVFSSGPSGRRAALAGGPDVWEIVAALRHTSGTERARVTSIAREFGIHARQVVIAFDYAAAHRAVIDARVTANDRALDLAERIASQRERLLA